MSEFRCPLEEFYSLKEIYKSAGESERLRKALDLLRERFTDNFSFVQWWYETNKGLKYSSPDQLCKEGKQAELESILIDTLIGAQGG
ncbi:MAG: hypothetical protein AABX64_01370 [Nanoarchaeota archaeon]